MSDRRRLIVAANASWNIFNYRLRLINFLRDQGHEVILLAPEDETSDILRRIGYRLVTFEMSRRGCRVDSEILVLYRLLVICRSIRPDAILSFTTKCNVYMGFVARILSISFFPNVCGRGSAFSRMNLLRYVIIAAHRIAFSSANRVFFQNLNDASFFYAHAVVRRERGEVLPGSGVELDRYRASALPGQLRAPTILMLARLIVEKGVREFAEAARVVKERYPEVRFVLAGRHDESEEHVSSEELGRWVAEDLIEYRGEVADVRTLVEAADIAALPSYYLEGTPRALLECAAMGRPIVTTDTPGCRETLIPHKTGLLVRPRDPADLAEKLLQLVDMPAHARAAMGVESRLHIERHFDDRIILDAYSAALEAQQQVL